MHRSSATWIAILALAAGSGPALQGCSTVFTPQRLQTPAELRDVQTKTLDDVALSVSMLTDDQARRHFGVAFAEYELQALWMSVRNGSDRRLWFIRRLLDADYYSADEVAHMVRKDVSRAEHEALRQFLRDEEIGAQLAPHTITEGFVFIPRVEGGRYVDVRLAFDAFESATLAARAGSKIEQIPHELRFDFALPLPDGEFDYERLDPARTYAGQVLRELSLEELRKTLERLPCCATDDDGTQEGDPLNVVMIGSGSEVLNSLSRSGWSFTHRITLRTIRREIGAAIAGAAYPVAPVSSLFAFGRKQDVALQRARRSISQRLHMRLWLAPFLFEGRSVWISQVSRDIGVKVTPKSPTLTTHVIDPAVDETREYLLDSLLAEGFVDRFGFVKGSAWATPSQPRKNLTDDPYFSDGMRLVVMLSRDPVPSEQVRSLLWEQSAAPIAEGQSKAARRNVRPIEPVARPE